MAQYEIFVDSGIVNISGKDVTITKWTSIADPGIFIITGYDNLPNININTGIYSFIGFNTNLIDSANKKLEALLTNYNINGKDTTLIDSANKILLTDLGIYSVIGITNILHEGFYIIPDASTFIIDGVKTNLQDSANRKLEAEIFSLSITEINNSLLWNQKLTLSTNIYTIKGFDTITGRIIILGDVILNMTVEDTVEVEELLINAQVNIDINLDGEVTLQ